LVGAGAPEPAAAELFVAEPEAVALPEPVGAAVPGLVADADAFPAAVPVATPLVAEPEAEPEPEGKPLAGTLAQMVLWRVVAAVWSACEHDARQACAAVWKAWLVQTHWMSVTPLQPAEVAAVVVQFRTHGGMPAVPVGIAAEPVPVGDAAAELEPDAVPDADADADED